MSSLRIIFMGTPEFAVASLAALIQHDFNIVAVVTSPGRLAGRGLQPVQSAVKKFALQHQLPVLQPLKLKDENFLQQLQELKADLQIVVAFRMLPEIVWNMPPLGTINLHASLLPDYRGAAPIQRAIINGEKETGLTTFKLQHEIDTGNILQFEKIKIGEKETAGELHDRMMKAGANLLVKTVDNIAAGNCKEIPQQEIFSSGKILHTAPKIFKEDGKIDWQKSVDDIYNLIRGLSPYPAAWIIFNNKLLKIFGAKKEKAITNSQPGNYESDRKNYLRFAAADGWIYLLDLQLEGKKRMQVVDFLRGYHFE